MFYRIYDGRTHVRTCLKSSCGIDRDYEDRQNVSQDRHWPIVLATRLESMFLLFHIWFCFSAAAVIENGARNGPS
jgi:hypothetical protein